MELYCWYRKEKEMIMHRDVEPLISIETWKKNGSALDFVLAAISTLLFWHSEHLASFSSIPIDFDRSRDTFGRTLCERIDTWDTWSVIRIANRLQTQHLNYQDPYAYPFHRSMWVLYIYIYIYIYIKLSHWCSNAMKMQVKAYSAQQSRTAEIFSF